MKREVEEMEVGDDIVTGSLERWTSSPVGLLGSGKIISVYAAV